MTVFEAIQFYQDVKDEGTKKICLEIMGEYYQKNLPAHLEYTERGFYDDEHIAEYIADFKRHMTQIETILKAQ